MKRKISLILTFILMLSTIFSVNVFAASYPSISSSKYIEFKAQQNINVYKDTNCKTRGTSSPSKKYNASISSGDTCYIYKIEKNYIQVNYPTSSGRRTGYIKRNALFDKTAPINYISSSKAKVTIHKSSSGSCVAKGDKVWEVDTKKEFSGYKAVIYEAKSGKRAYKLGYVTESDLNKIKGNKSTQKTNTSKNDVPDSVKLEFKLTMLHNAAANLSSKKANAESVIDVACDAELMKNIQKTLGVSTIAVATLNPTKMLEVLDTSAASGVVALTITNAFYESAVESHNKYLKAAKNITTIKQADTAFKYCVDALSKYNAVIDANIDTVKRYTSLANCTIDMLESYCSSVANAAIPGNEYKAILNACEIATTVAELGDLVGDKYAGYDALKNTVNTWYASWNKIK
ncbi:MAG: hypothetical protein J6C82_02950 [Clostridia bacterium]|nr:hypothetical protein [Clostridia bacterium]